MLKCPKCHSKGTECVCLCCGSLVNLDKIISRHLLTGCILKGLCLDSDVEEANVEPVFSCYVTGERVMLACLGCREIASQSRCIYCKSFTDLCDHIKSDHFGRKCNKISFHEEPIIRPSQQATINMQPLPIKESVIDLSGDCNEKDNFKSSQTTQSKCPLQHIPAEEHASSKSPTREQGKNKHNVDYVNIGANHRTSEVGHPGEEARSREDYPGTEDQSGEEFISKEEKAGEDQLPEQVDDVTPAVNMNDDDHIFKGALTQDLQRKNSFASPMETDGCNLSNVQSQPPLPETPYLMHRENSPLASLSARAPTGVRNSHSQDGSPVQPQHLFTNPTPPVKQRHGRIPHDASSTTSSSKRNLSQSSSGTGPPSHLADISTKSESSALSALTRNSSHGDSSSTRRPRTRISRTQPNGGYDSQKLLSRSKQYAQAKNRNDMKTLAGANSSKELSNFQSKLYHHPDESDGSPSRHSSAPASNRPKHADDIPGAASDDVAGRQYELSHSALTEPTEDTPTKWPTKRAADVLQQKTHEDDTGLPESATRNTSTGSRMSFVAEKAHRSSLDHHNGPSILDPDNPGKMPQPKGNVRRSPFRGPSQKRKMLCSDDSGSEPDMDLTSSPTKKAIVSIETMNDDNVV